VVRERMTQADIAARIGGSREMVSRILSDLAAGGYLAVESKRIVLHRKLPSHW
jgi:CRP/FNR family cyclic AMP-dependent transcriptional regulator